MNIKKPHFNDFSEDTPGPYYDPNDGHIHNWKNSSLIKNFIGEQNPRNRFYSTDNIYSVKNGEYCCICHKRKSGFISVPILVTKIETKIETKMNAKMETKIETKLPNKKVNQTKFEYYKEQPRDNTNTPLVLYKLNLHETLYIKSNEMTYYQKFKHSNPDYKREYSFIINNTNFNFNYYVIETA